jgi:hypothetical protein
MSSDISVKGTAIMLKIMALGGGKGIFVLLTACDNIPIDKHMRNLLYSVTHDMGVPQRKYELLKATQLGLISIFSFGADGVGIIPAVRQQVIAQFCCKRTVTCLWLRDE